MIFLASSSIVNPPPTPPLLLLLLVVAAVVVVVVGLTSCDDVFVVNVFDCVVVPVPAKQIDDTDD